jgi:carbon-monoxide dehydrogenase small subunit
MTTDEPSQAETVSIKLNVNGRAHPVTIDPRFLLSDVIREQLSLTGLHVGCEQGVCGACTVLIDGEPVVSCLMLAAEVGSAEIQTVEHFSMRDGKIGELEAAFLNHGAFQCGFCTPGFLAVGHYILDQGLAKDRATIRANLSGNICRCTGYESIIDAIVDVAEDKK